MLGTSYLFGLLVTLAQAAGPWTSLAPGIELGTFTVNTPSPVGDSRLTIVRIDPCVWDLEVVGTSWTGESSGKTAEEWCTSHKLVAAINAGMFATDHRTHVGFLKSKGHVNSSRVNGYLSAAAFHPKEGTKVPEFRIFDLDDPGTTIQSILGDYSSVIQNLRLIKHPGENRWSRQERRWSEAALGEDDAGRVLFIFSRSPFTMHDLNRELLALDIGLAAAQHLEGGPEAQLYLKIGDFELELHGSYETSFMEGDANPSPWPIPIVLGVHPKKPASNKR